nr:radical SAM protein [uncultured Agathobaculum sp.]
MPLDHYLNAISGLDQTEEQCIKYELEKAGLFSHLSSFPLACLQFELTSNCNANCLHCYNNSFLNKTADDMTPQKWKDFSKYLVEHGGVFECIISGGEPLLLGNSLFEIMDILHHDGTCFLFETNGFLLNKSIVNRLSIYRYHWLQISVDGCNPQYHDTFRQLNGCWEKAVNGIRLSVRANIPVKIAHCVTPYNIHDIDKMCALAYSLGVSAITIGELCLSGRTNQHRELLLTEYERKLLTDKVNDNRAKYEPYMRVKRSNSICEGLKKHMKKPYSSAFIRPNGDVRIDGMAPFVVGNILQEDFCYIWEKKLAQCWEKEEVQQFINGFDKTDRNYKFINYFNKDIYFEK